MTNEVKFREYMAALGELHDRKISDMLLSLYWKALEPFSDEACEMAFRELIFSTKFFPKPVELIEIMQCGKESRSLNAWIETVSAIRCHGNYVSIRFDDPVIHSVIKFMGGWQSTGDWMDVDLKWKQKEFERLYNILATRKGGHPEYLPGLHEINNAANGWNVTPEIVDMTTTPQHQITENMRNNNGKKGFEDRHIPRRYHGPGEGNGR